MLVQAKFYIPESKVQFIQRVRLYKKLDQGMDHKLTLLTAATGNGKSTLLGQWTRTIQYPVCWFNIDRYDNDEIGFWTQMTKSLYPVFPDIDKEVLEGDMNENKVSKTFITKLVRIFKQYDRPFILIWDDFHFLTDDSLIESIDYFIKVLPENVHIFMTSRTQPLLSLSKIRLRADLHELEERELRFTIEEIKELLKKALSLKLNQDLVVFIQQRTEGWITGIRMFTLLLERYHEQGITLDKELVQSITGGHKYIAGYFLEEIFNKLSPEKQLYLLQTSILERLNIPLIEAVTGQDYGQVFLNYIEKENLFLTPLDFQNQWFRYHPLFKEFLQMELLTHFPEMKKEIHLKAAGWLEEKGNILEAIDHYLSAESYEIALRLLKRMIPTLLQEEQSSLSKWLHQIPNDLLFTHPRLYLANAVSLYLSGFIEESIASYWWAIERLTQKPSVLTKEDRKEFIAGLDFLVAFRSFIEKDFASFLTYSKKYLDVLPKGDLFVNYGADKDGHHLVWDVFISDEFPQQADVILQEALALWEKTANDPFYAHLCMDYARLLYEKNQLQEATYYVGRATSIGEDYQITSLIFGSKFLFTKISFALGYREKAFRLLNELEQSIKLETYPLIAQEIQIYRDLLMIKTKEIEQTRIDLVYRELEISDHLSSSSFEKYYVFAYLLHVHEKPLQAIQLLQRLITIIEKTGYRKNEVRSKIYLSYLLHDQQQYIEGYKTLESALHIAERKGYIRTVLDEGEVVVKVLHHYISSVQKNHYMDAKKKNFDYAKFIMRQFMHEKDAHKCLEKEEEKMPENILLTAKEQIVLTCIDQGLSNREIALELHVSLSTVKTHINHLYRKLNVNNRILAIQRARELTLL